MVRDSIPVWLRAGEVVKLVNFSYYKELEKELGGVKLTDEVFEAGGIYFVRDRSYDNL